MKTVSHSKPFDCITEEVGIKKKIGNPSKNREGALKEKKHVTV